MGGSLDGWVDGGMNGVGGRINGQMNGVGERMDKWLSVCLSGWMGRWIGG